MQVRQRTQISLEAVKYQTDKKMYKSLVTFLQMMRDTNTDQVDAFRSIQNELTRTIAHFLKLPVEFKLVEDGPRDYVLAVLPPIFTEKHPLVTGRYSNTVSEKNKLGVLKELYQNPSSLLEFGIDYETGKASGFATQMASTIYIGRSVLMDGNVTPEWIAATLVHELGHIEGFYLALRYVTSCSWAIRFAVEMLDNTENQNDFIVTAEKIGAVIGAEDIARVREVEAHAKKELVTAIIMDKFRDRTRSELGTAFGDQTGNEALADQFLVRFGDPLAQAQFVDYVLTQQRGMTSNLKVGLSAQGIAAAVACLIIAPVFGAGVVMAGAMVGSVLAGSAMLRITGNNTATNTAYDKPFERVSRMRSELIAAIKETDDPNVRAQILVEIKALDGILPDLKKHDPILGKVQLAFSSSLRKLRREQSAIRSLEELFNNPLYLRHAQLSKIHEIEG